MNCMDCNAEADVAIEDAGFCCEHYQIRATNMRRNADGLVYESSSGTWRYPTEEERGLRRKMDLKRAERSIKRSAPKQEGLKKIQLFLGKEKP